jgi:hypothetical protein
LTVTDQLFAAFVMDPVVVPSRSPRRSIADAEARLVACLPALRVRETRADRAWGEMYVEGSLSRRGYRVLELISS